MTIRTDGVTTGHIDAAPSPALTREALADVLMDLRVDWPWSLPDSRVAPDQRLTYQEAMRKLADSILAALGTPPPAPSSTREET